MGKFTRKRIYKRGGTSSAQKPEASLTNNNPSNSTEEPQVQIAESKLKRLEEDIIFIKDLNSKLEINATKCLAQMDDNEELIREYYETNQEIIGINRELGKENIILDAENRTLKKKILEMNKKLAHEDLRRTESIRIRNDLIKKVGKYEEEKNDIIQKIKDSELNNKKIKPNVLRRK